MNIENANKFKLVSILSKVVVVTVVVICIAFFLTFLLPGLVCGDDAFQNGAAAKISQLSSQLKLYKLDNGEYPTTDQGLQALVANPGGKKNWRQVASSIDKDPWGNPYQYQFSGVISSSSFYVWSFGADGVAGGEGLNADVGNWPDSE